MMLWLSLFFCTGPLDLAALNEPVYHGTQPVIQDNRLYIYDRADGYLKAYEIETNGSLHCAWQAGGKGQGPGEFDDHNINGITVHAKTGNVWVSYLGGAQVFDRNGNWLRKTPIRNRHQFNDAIILPFDNRLAFTATNELEKQALLTVIEKGRPEPIFQVPDDMGLPKSKFDVFLDDSLELYRIQAGFVMLRRSIGQAYRLDDEGTLKWAVALRQQLPEYLIADAFLDNYQYGTKKLSHYPLPEHQSGFAKTDDAYWFLACQYAAGVRTSQNTYQQETYENGEYRLIKTLIAMDPATGVTRKSLFHPALLTPMSIVAYRNEHFWLFDLSATDRIQRIAIKDFEQVQSLVF